MSQYLVLSKIRVQNANAIHGFTWGGLGVTQLMGFTHALSRKISDRYNGGYTTEFSGCAIIANRVDSKVYQPKPYADFEFIQSKNPPTLAKDKDGKKIPIIEEGKLNATISLIIELTQSLTFTIEQTKNFEKLIFDSVSTMRVAGGTVLSVEKVRLISISSENENKQLSQIKRLCMPGFILKDRSDYLRSHVENLKSSDDAKSDVLNAWLDFLALKKQTTFEEIVSKKKSAKKAFNEIITYLEKPQKGYLVPIMAGFKSIASPCKKDELRRLRIKTDSNEDKVKNVVFVEAVHSIGEWVGLHKVKELNDFIWRYHQENEWYLCHPKGVSHSISNPKAGEEDFTDELNNLFENEL